ncbi:hypothetical protein JCM10207_008497 [Rhodosporidiobolus poonsookiae]
MSPVLSYRQTVDVIHDFLEIAFHTLLYVRQVYPASLFSKAQSYNIEVYQSRNPVLSEYIGRVLQCVREELYKGTVRKVIFVIKDVTLEEKPLERYVFDFEWAISERAIPKDKDDFTPAKHGLGQGDVEDLLRACILKLHFCNSGLKRLPAETSFAVVLEMKDDAPAPETKASREGLVAAQWVPAEQRHAAEDDGTGPGRGHRSAGLSSISPLDAVRFGVINMSMAVEETAEKFEEDELLSSAEGVATEPVPDRKGKGRAA